MIAKKGYFGTMRSKNDYVPTIWPESTRVRLLKEDHRKSGEYATIVRVLPNPSNRFENQWYDVQFYDGVYGRFLGRHLEYIPAAAGAETLAESAA